MADPKYIEYDGLKFCRDDRTGYYLNSTIRKRLHRYVWENEKGSIPAGYHVHHIDGNKANNAIENLELLSSREHQVLHGADPERKDNLRKSVSTATKAARGWHGSEEGRRWHSEHMKGFKQPRSSKVCEYCGAIFQGVKGQKYCSNACKSAARRASGADDIEAVCPICGSVFRSNKYAGIKYCSRTCTYKAHIGWADRKKNGG